MSVDLLPDWLPDGWIMEIRSTRSGSKRRYYTSPLSGSTFQTKEQVLRYLNVDKVKQGEQQFGDLPEWLPAGWFVEIKPQENGVDTRQQSECYCDPSSGSRFNSKEEVFQYLKTRKLGGLTNNRKKSIQKSSFSNVLAHVESSPDGLPHGWIKEIKIRKKSNAKDGLRKDPYYTDPVSGYVFRSLKDCFRYIETGEISKYAIGPKKRDLKEMQSFEKESPSRTSAKKVKSQGCTVRRSLFTEANGEMILQIDGTSNGPQSSSSAYASTWCGEDVNPFCLTPLSAKRPKGTIRKQKKMMGKPATEKLPEVVNSSKPKNKKHKVSMAANGIPEIEESSMKLNLTRGGLSEQTHLDLQEGQLQNVRVTRSSGRLRKKQSGQLPTENTTELGTLKHLEMEKAGLQLLEPQNNSSKPVEKPSELENEKLLEEQQSRPPSRKAVAMKRSGSRKTNTQKAIILPPRRSKRLVRLNTNSIAEYGTVEQADHLLLNPRKEFDSSNHQNAVYAIDLEAPQLDISKGFLTQGKPSETTSELPFGDFWPDPCIEFAFRTLTSDIPALEDTKAIEDYFQQQLISVQSSSPGGLVSSTLVVPEISSQSPFVPSEHQGKLRPSSLKHRSSMDLKVQKEPRRSTRLRELDSIVSLG